MILLCVYTYNLPSVVEENDVKCKMFADDVKIYKTIVSEMDSVLAQEAIERVAK